MITGVFFNIKSRTISFQSGKRFSPPPYKFVPIRLCLNSTLARSTSWTNYLSQLDALYVFCSSRFIRRTNDETNAMTILWRLLSLTQWWRESSRDVLAGMTVVFLWYYFVPSLVIYFLRSFWTFALTLEMFSWILHQKMLSRLTSMHHPWFLPTRRTSWSII